MVFWYKLDGRTPVPCSREEAEVLLGQPPHVADEMIEDVRVSTVFLVLDHSILNRTAPVLFETMAFGGPVDGGRR